MTSNSLSDKIVLVLGASRGIGAAAARVFAREGATVVLAARSEDALRSLVRDIPGSSHTSSVGSLSGDPLLSAYSAAKRGVNSITESAAKFYGRDRIRVNAVAPGLILTEMVDDWEKADPGVIDRITESNPLGRAGTAEEVAEAAAWLLSDRSSYVTGVTLPVTGGTGI